MAVDLKSGGGELVRIVTGCSSLDEFTSAFRGLCTPTAIFLPMREPLGLATNVRYAIALKNTPTGARGKVIFRGTGEISQAYENANNLRKRTGVLLELGRLDSMGRILLGELNTVRKSQPGADAPNADSDESFDVSTLVETASLEELKKKAVEEAARRKALEKQPKGAFSGPSGRELDRLVTCVVQILNADSSLAKAGGGTSVGPAQSKRETTQVADEGTQTGPPETTQVAEGDAVEGTSTGDAERTGVADLDNTEVGEDEDDESEATQIVETPPPPDVPMQALVNEVTRERLPSSTEGTMELDIDEDVEAEEESTRVASVPGIEDLGDEDDNDFEEDLGESTRVVAVPTPPPPEAFRDDAAPAAASAAAEAPTDFEEVADDGIDEVTQIPVRAPVPPVGAAPMIPMIPLAPSTPASVPMIPLAPSTPASVPMIPLAPSTPVAVPEPALSNPALSNPALSNPALPSPVLPVESANAEPVRPSTAQPSAPEPGIAVEEGGDAIASAIADSADEPTAASRPLPGAEPPVAAARSIASLPMVTPTMAGGGTSEPPTKAMVSRNQAGMFGALCLVAGLGFGLLLGGGGSKSSKGAAAAPSQEANLPVAAATRPDPAPTPTPIPVFDAAVAEAVQYDAAMPIDAGAPDAAPAVAASPCEVILDVLPVDANIFLGEIEVQPGLLKVPVPCGTTAVSIKHDGFANFRADVDVVADTPTTVVHHMKRGRVMLRVLSTPRKAWVQINGEGIGKTPLRRRVTAHEPLEIKVSRKGFRPLTKEVTPTEDLVLDLKLRRWGKKRRRGGKRR